MYLNTNNSSYTYLSGIEIKLHTDICFPFTTTIIPFRTIRKLRINATINRNNGHVATTQTEGGKLQYLFFPILILLYLN